MLKLIHILKRYVDICEDSIKKIRYPAPKILTIEESVDFFLEEPLLRSISRYGDGELELMYGRDIPFQRYDENLNKRLREILQYDDVNFMVCLSDVYGSLKWMKYDAYCYWFINLKYSRKEWYNVVKRDKIYYNTFLSRFYYIYKDKSHCDQFICKLKKIWEGRELVIIEGMESRLGIGNDLFNSAKNIKRVLCPSENAFQKYEEILKVAKEFNNNKLFILALGPTATVLSFDLYKAGYQSVDLGHVDIEYEWYLMGATKKVAVKGKYTNEAVDKNGRKVDDCNDKEYQNEIYKIVQ